jgi:hypothetical protein
MAHTALPPPPPQPSIPLPAMWILPSLKRWLCQKMRQCATSKKCKFLYVNIVWILIRIQLNLDGGWGRWGDIVSLGCLSLEYNVHVHWLQGFGSVSGSGSACIRSNLSCWIRIHIQIVDPDPRWQNWTKKMKQRIEFSSFGAGCSLLRPEGFSCSFGVLYGGLGISK